MVMVDCTALMLSVVRSLIVSLLSCQTKVAVQPDSAGCHDTSCALGARL